MSPSKSKKTPLISPAQKQSEALEAIQSRKPKDLINLAEVLRRTSISRPTIYRYIKKGVFPAPKKIEGVLKWQSGEIDRWWDGLASVSYAPKTAGGHK